MTFASSILAAPEMFVWGNTGLLGTRAVSRPVSSHISKSQDYRPLGTWEPSLPSASARVPWIFSCGGCLASCRLFVLPNNLLVPDMPGSACRKAIKCRLVFNSREPSRTIWAVRKGHVKMIQDEAGEAPEWSS